TAIRLLMGESSVVVLGGGAGPPKTPAPGRVAFPGF
ncbi:TIGR01777 family oxidoreductase, partial [Enterobacter hormaechei]